MITDADLVNRLERSAAALTVATVESMRRIDPRGPGSIASFLGGALVSTGAGGYVNRAVGIGDATITVGDIDEFEAFYESRHQSPSIEVSSWADATLLEHVRQRQYTADWFRSVFVGEVIPNARDVRPVPTVEIGMVDEALVGTWLDVLYEGVAVKSAAARAVSDAFGRARVGVAQSTSFIAWLDGEPAGCGTVECGDGVGWCGAAATVPRLARRGVQSALLRHRIGWANDAGCDLVAATAIPAGVSARNLLRHGFELAYSQLVMTRAPSNVR